MLIGCKSKRRDRDRDRDKERKKKEANLHVAKCLIIDTWKRRNHTPLIRLKQQSLTPPTNQPANQPTSIVRSRQIEFAVR